MANLDDIMYKNEDEYMKEAVRRTLSKPRVWDPDTEGVYASEKEFLKDQLYRRC